VEKVAEIPEVVRLCMQGLPLTTGFPVKAFCERGFLLQWGVGIGGGCLHAEVMNLGVEVGPLMGFSSKLLGWFLPT